MEDDVATRKTYRYLRIGMIAAVVFLGAGVVVEHHNVGERDCWQTSISAYYYTPVRAVFVGALMVIGASLIVIKGSKPAEDMLLNVAGMLAPVVALVPISDVGSCYSIPPDPLPTAGPPENATLAPWVLNNIDNNIRALLWAGAVSLTIAVCIAAIAFAVGVKRGEQRTLSDIWKGPNRGTFFGLVLVSVLLIVTGLLFHFLDDEFRERAHGLAAGTMFVLLAIAAGLNAWDCSRSNRPKYAWLYGIIAALMVGAFPLMLAKGWKHHTLGVEMIEIALFAAFWAVQTRELWHNTVRSAPDVPLIAPGSTSIG